MGERINAANFAVDGNVVRELRNRLGLSQNALVDASGVSKAYISLIENGWVRDISQEVASSLAVSLGVKKEQIQSRSKPSRSKEQRPLLDSLKSLRSEVRALDRRLTRIIDSADQEKSK